MEDELLTVDDVARTLKVTRQHVYTLMNAGLLDYVQIGLRRGRRVRRSALERFLKQDDRGVDQGSYTEENQRTPMPAAA